MIPLDPLSGVQSNANALVAPLLAFVVVLFLVRGLFGFLGWLSEDSFDSRLRRPLDRMFDHLTALPLPELAMRGMRRFVKRWDLLFGFDGPGFVRYLAMSGVLNLLLWGLPILTTLGMANPPMDRFHIAAIGICVGLGIDLMVGTTSWSIGRALANAKNIGVLLGWCLVDVGLLSVAIGLNFYATFYAHDLLAAWGYAPATVRIIPAATDAWLVLTMGWFVLAQEGISWLGKSIIVLGASLQTACYLVVGIIVLVLRILPRRVQSLITLVTYRLASDKTTVFSRLGMVVGSIGGLIAAFLAYLRARPS